MLESRFNQVVGPQLFVNLEKFIQALSFIERLKWLLLKHPFSRAWKRRRGSFSRKHLKDPV